MKRFLIYFRDPSLFLVALVTKCNFLFPDKLYLQILFRLKMGYKLNLNNPQTFSEKLQWLKLHDRNPEYIKMVDKFLVKEYVANKIGPEHVIQTIGVWDSPDAIDWDCLPNQFVLKVTHGGGNCGVVICKDKKSFDKQTALKKIKRGWRQNLFATSREWPYKYVKHRIIAEKYMEDSVTKELRDYKFFCFNGEVKALFIGTERQKQGEDVKFDFFDADFNHLCLRQGHDSAKKCPEKPQSFEQMKSFASILSKGMPHVRVDLYEVNGNVFFGEMTFYHFGGMVRFKPEEWDMIFGKWLVL